MQVSLFSPAIVAAEREQNSVTDLKSSLLEVVNDPRLFSHASTAHNATVTQIYDTADISNKRKRKRPTVADPTQQLPEVIEFQKKLDASQLRSSS